MADDNGIFLAAPAGDSPDRLASYISYVKQADTLAPVTVIGPSVYANLSLRHNLGKSGLANVRFLVLPRLAEFLGAPSLYSENRRPLTSILESASIRAVSGQASGMLRELRSHPSTHQSLKNTFRQLRYASSEALDRLSTHGELRREVVELYRRFREHTSEFYDKEDLAQAAAKAIREGRTPGLSDLGFIIFFQVRDFTPAEREMIEALSAAGQCAVFLSLTGDKDADASVNALAERLALFLGEAERPPPAQTSGDTQLLIAPDPHQEIRWVIRQIMKQAEDGLPFHRMAILYRKQAPYSTLIREELGLAGIPVAGPNPSPLSDTAVGKALVGLIGLSDGQFTRDSVTSWLAGCPVRPPGGNPESFSPSLWDSISKKAGVVRGLDQWKQRLERYAAEMERNSEEAEAREGFSQARVALMRSESDAARNMLQFINDLSEYTTPPADGSSWKVFCGWATGLLNRYLIADTEIPEAEQEGLQKIKELLSELEGAEAIEAGPTFSAFAQALDEGLQASLGHLGVTGQGVFVAPIGTAAAMSFDVVHIVGMIEGAVPPATRDDPLIPDRDRQAAGGTSEGLPLQQARKADERYAFLSALATAPVRKLSFPVADPAGQRGHYPSRWFLEQASILEGSPVYSSTLWSLSHRTWLTVIPSIEQSLATVADASAADVHDYDLEKLWTWKMLGLSVGSHPLVKSGLLDKSLKLGRSRFGAGFTEWDGNVSSATAGSRFADRLETSVHSPTSLERWAECPFSYFLSNILGIGSLDKPEEIYSITPLERGSLGHEILEKFISAIAAEGTLPKPDEPWNDHHRDILKRVAESAFQDAESRGVTGKGVMWQLVRVDILNDLETFLEEDSRLREKFGVSPVMVEARFGLPDSAWSEAFCVLDDGTTLKFRGIIDRVDADPEGKRVLVLDYKTGGVGGYSRLKDDPVDKGKRLQLGVYSLAAQGAMGNDVEVKAAYWFVTNRQGFVLAPPEPISMDDIQERFKEAATTIVSGIKGGLFPANPGKEDRNGFENCTYCDFNSLCPARRDVLWAKKKGNSILADYLELSGEG